LYMEATENCPLHVDSNGIHHSHLVVGRLPNAEARHSKLQVFAQSNPF
jgi:hypothetical protein